MPAPVNSNVRCCVKMDFIKRHLFLTYGLVALLIHGLLLVSGAQYDSGGLAGLLILTSPIWGAIYWAPNEFIFALKNGVAIEGQEIVSILVGLGICLVADYFLNSIRKKKRDMPVNT